MTLTPLHKHLIRRTFTRLVIDAEKAAGLFRQRLGELNPRLLPSMSMDAQPYRPMESLALVISLLDQPTILRAKLKTMQQARDGLSEDNLQQIGDVLLWVVEQELGDAFTAEIQTAWLEFYRYLLTLTSG